MALPMAGLILLVLYSLINPENFIEAVPQRDVATKTCSNLFGPDDKIQLLSSNNFNENIYNLTTASLVQFYTCNCQSCHSDCEKAAPILKQLAASIYNWRDVIKIKVVNCGENQNTRLCQEYGITEYPTIRYFPPLVRNFNTGKPVSKNAQDYLELKTEIIKLLQNTETKLFNWPDFSPVDSSNISSIRQSNNHRLIILVVEKPDSYLGRQLILDLYAVRNVAVRYTFDEKLSNTEERLPQVFAMKSVNAPKQLALTIANRYGVFKSVQDHLRKEGQEIQDIENIAEEEPIYGGLSEEEEATLQAYLLIIQSLAKAYQKNLK